VPLGGAEVHSSVKFVMPHNRQERQGRKVGNRVAIKPSGNSTPLDEAAGGEHGQQGLSEAWLVKQATGEWRSSNDLP
jgi:hypothetical protein